MRPPRRGRAARRPVRESTPVEGFDVVGIGAGPSNLSLAALAHPVGSLRSRFYEVKPHFQWHPGIMLPEAELQVSFLKDLVSLVDPTSEFSFLNFLSHEGRIFRALVANGLSSSRQEFEQYYRWVADRLPAIRWGQRVKSVSLGDGCFEVACEGGEVATATTLSLGSGREPHIPEFAAALRGRQVLHGGDIMLERPETRGRRVMVVGAGQSGAEVVNYLLSEDSALPSSLTWISSRVGFQPIDDSPFTNEWFAPPYVGYFTSLPPSAVPSCSDTSACRATASPNRSSGRSTGACTNWTPSAAAGCGTACWPAGEWSTCAGTGTRCW